MSTLRILINAYATISTWTRLLSLPRTLTTLKISRCPRSMSFSGGSIEDAMNLALSTQYLNIYSLHNCVRFVEIVNGGALHHGFHHLSNLTSLTLCSELLFTDETFLIALKTLSQLTRFVYVYPCDAVQPVWRDLFRYCSSCELYHRRVTTKTYSRTLMMPELPDQIQDFTFEMDEPRFQESRIETFENNRHGLDRKDIRYAVTLWKADDSTAIQSQTPHWCGFDLAQDEVRSWWPANLTRLDLSKSIVTGSTFDVPPQLQELVIAYPLEPNEMTAIEDDGSGLSIEEKQWYPESLSTLEIRGVPYHVPCVIHDESDTKIRGWMVSRACFFFS